MAIRCANVNQFWSDAILARDRLGNEFITQKTALREPGPVRFRERLGGVLKFYYREAA
jgi:hypothetical protein